MRVGTPEDQHRLTGEPRLRNGVLRFLGKIGGLARSRYDLPLHEPSAVDTAQIESAAHPADVPEQFLTVSILPIEQPLVAHNVAATGKPQIVHVPESSRVSRPELN